MSNNNEYLIAKVLNECGIAVGKTIAANNFSRLKFALRTYGNRLTADISAENVKLRQELKQLKNGKV